MAEGNVSVVANRILGLMASSVIRETFSLWGAADELKELMYTIEAIKHMPDEVELSDEDKIRLENAVYQADDLVDEIFTVALGRRNMSRAEKVRAFFSTSLNNHRLAFRRKLGYEIKRVKKRLRECAKREPTFEPSSALPEEFRHRMMTHSFVPEDDVIGRNADRMEIVNLILLLQQPPELTDNKSKDDKDLRVVPVVGVAGIGKTTLAKLVYNDEAVRRHFELELWVCIATDLSDTRFVVMSLIGAATRVRPYELDQMDQLQKELRNILNGKRCFLVLDDIVTIEDRENWISLRNLLMGCAKGSCVLVTTRSENVAKIMCTVQPYHLDRLGEEDSWLVFKRGAFGKREEQQDREIVELGKDIAAKCEGIPLFIREIASALWMKQDLNEWRNFDVEERLERVRPKLSDSHYKARTIDDETHSYVREEDITGRNSDKTEIIKLMLEADVKSKENVRVIPIVGIVGIGKTTLAQFVFNDKMVEQNFELRIWVCVSGLIDAKLIVRKLTQAATSVRHDYLQMDQVQKELRKAINGKRFFLVLDDMVDENRENWLSLKNLLMACAKGSCVLVTTRSEEVAKITRTVQPHHLDRLTEEDSWVLFKRYAFHSSQEQQDQEIEKIGRAIAAKCGGVPLFLRAIAHTLYVVPCDQWRNYDIDHRLHGVKQKSEFLSSVKVEETRDRDANEVRRQTHSFIPQEVVIGRDDDKEAITELLLKDNLEEDVLVIPIVGIGGLGKTALAQLIFNDEKVQGHFDLKIWVCVTDVFGLRVIMEKIFVSITSKNPEDLAIDQLQMLICQEIQGKRYLLVLDDVWNENAQKWRELKDLLSYGANGSRIIVTTRSRTVAEITGAKQQYELSFLDEKKSWSLFLKVAFEQGQQPTDSLTIKIGQDIVKMCGGIPLVIRTIGSILFSKDPKIEWQSFYDKELPKILQNEADVLASLRLSYDHLSPPLKECFAHCGLFPKDYEIDVETLIKLWISQGFIEPYSSQHLEDLGYGYFMDLLRRSFFQETKKDEQGNITKCKLQNLMHDLARLVAGSASAILGLKWGKSDRELRHISFDFHLDSSWQIPVPLAELKRVRTLILPRQVRWEIEGRSSESVCDRIIKFKFLRMLDLHNSGIKVLPYSIGELGHLRYLDLSQNVSIKALPNSISRLQNLQTLKLNHCSNLQTLPREIKKLVNLRNLENESCYSLTHMPPGLSQLLNLRTLSEFVLSKGTGSVSNQSGKLNELQKLNDLRGKLRIKNLRSREGEKTAEANLYEKQHLLSLILIWDIDVYVDPADCEKSLEDLRPHTNLRELSLSAYNGVQFSTWLPLHTTLVKFSLSKCIRCRCLPQLDHLPSLEVLVVDDLTELEYISEETFRTKSRTFFPSLKELRLTNLPKLKGWWKDASDNVEEEITFACLSKLIVEDCSNLMTMPLFPCLEELLVLKNTCWKPLRQTIKAKNKIPRTSEFEASSSSSTSSAVSPLSRLRTLCIIHMANGEPNMWQSLPSLRSLTLDHLDDLNGLLEGLQQVTSLQELHIWRCDGLKEIPSWISGIKSLKTISIKLCPNLTIPRDRIGLITSLKKVEIEDCPRVPHIESMLKDRFYT